MAGAELRTERSDAAQGHFLALAECLRDLEMVGLLGRLGEIYVEFLRERVSKTTDH